MYTFEWKPRTGGYRLSPESGKYVAAEIRPVFAEELVLVGFNKYFTFNIEEKRPFMWARRNVYIYKGEEVVQLNRTQYGQPLNPSFLVPAKKLKPVDIGAMLVDETNVSILSALVANTLKRIKEMYDRSVNSCDIAYIGFSGGKDSVVLLDLCHRVLPLSVPVIFSDTDMELPDTYKMWDEIQEKYPGRPFIKVCAKQSALKNWDVFGPPSRTIRWCCSVHKSTPAILKLREMVQKPCVKAMAFLGVRSDESLKRDSYEDIGEAVKNASQTNAYPILSWGAHELWLYIFLNKLPINDAYRNGLPRVGCILCPEASEKYAWFVNAVYPNVISPYNKAILEAVDKHFKSDADKLDYLSGAGWQARKSGEVLKQTLTRPQEIQNGDTLTWTVPVSQLNAIREWLKTTGHITRNESLSILHYTSPRTHEKHEITVKVVRENAQGKVVCTFDSAAEIRAYSKYIRNVFIKALACVGCRACEVECPTGALTFSSSGVVHVNTSKCINCMNRHSADCGCWRYKSMYVSEMASTELSTINKYTNFGLRTEWVSVYMEEKNEFSQTTRLGRKMIPAARAWFRQAMLMQEKSCEPMKLLTVAEKYGVNAPLFWDAVWMGLANRAAIVKWFVTTLKSSQAYTQEEMLALLGTDIKETTKQGGLAALKDMLTKTPLGMSDMPIVSLALKGKANHVVSVSRMPHEVSPLVTLYGLYVIAKKASRETFTVSQMISADFSAGYVSPLIAFAMSVADFKTQLVGLATKYPDFIHCPFQMGLDEVRVYPDKKSADDVIDLMLNETR